MANFFKLLIIAVSIAGIVVSIFIAWPAIEHIRLFATEPASMQSTVDGMGNLIGASDLNVPIVSVPRDDGSESTTVIQVGRLAAVVMSMVAHLLWFWVPLVLIKASAHMLLAVAKSSSKTVIRPTPDK